MIYIVNKNIPWIICLSVCVHVCVCVNLCFSFSAPVISIRYCTCVQNVTRAISLQHDYHFFFTWHQRMGLPMSIFIIYLFIFFFLPNIFKNSELQFWRGKEVKGTWFWLVLVFAKMRYLLGTMNHKKHNLYLKLLLIVL